MGTPSKALSGGQIRPALSVRIGESSRDKSRLALDWESLLDMASAQGFIGISVRASAVSVHSRRQEQEAFGQALRARNLTASMVTGDLPLAINNAAATDALHNISPYLDLAQRVGAKLVRIMVHDLADIELVRRACDLAARRDLVLAQQCHWGSMAETVDECLHLVERIDHQHFGITFEPANLMAALSEYGATAIDALAPHIVNLYFQNLCLDPESPVTFKTRQGSVGVRFLPLGDPDGIALEPVMQALLAHGYAGWFTIHQPLLESQGIEQAIVEAGNYARAVLNKSAAW